MGIDVSETPASGPAPSRRSNVLLIVSLCLNVAFIAMIAIGIVNAMRFRAHFPPGGPLAPQAMLEVANPAERPKIQAIIDAHAQHFGDLRKASWDARMAAFRVFTSSGFTQSDFEKALERVHEADSALQQEGISVTAAAAAQLSPDERQAIAAKIRAHRRGFRFFYPHRGP